MAGYTFTISGGAASPQLRPGEDERARLLGKDIFFDGDFHVAPDGDWLLVAGLEAMRQAVYHRLITRPGEFKYRPEYGVGCQDYVKEEKTPARISELQTRIRAQLLRDRRIESVAVAIEELESALKVSVGVTVNGQALTFRPFLFTEDKV